MYSLRHQFTRHVIDLVFLLATQFQRIAHPFFTAAKLFTNSNKSDHFYYLHRIQFIHNISSGAKTIVTRAREKQKIFVYSFSPKPLPEQMDV